jgi:hypothetical protein
VIAGLVAPATAAGIERLSQGEQVVGKRVGERQICLPIARASPEADQRRWLPIKLSADRR